MSWPAELRAILAEIAGKAAEKPAPEPTPTKSKFELRLETLTGIRDHLRKVGAVLAAGGTALVAGLGWVQLHNVFPVPQVEHRWLVAAVAGAGSLGALLGVGWLIQLLYSAQRRIPISSDPARLGDLGLNANERAMRDNLFASVAEEHGHTTLRALELEARRVAREADAATDPLVREPLEKKAARLQEALDESIVGAAALVLESRANRVFRGNEAKVAFTIAVVGIVLAYGAADYSKGQRDLIALRKSCAEALAAGARDPCASVVAFQSTTPAAGAAAGTPAGPEVVVGVAGGRGACRVVVRVDGKRTNATKAGPVRMTINDRSRACGVRVSGAGLALESSAPHVGVTTNETRLKALSYRVVLLERRGASGVAERAVDPLVAAP